MGKATILSHKGNGLYNVRIEKDLSGYDLNIDLATIRETELTNVEIPALETAENNAEIAYAQSLTDQETAIATYNASEKTESDRQTLTLQNIATRDARVAWETAKSAWRRALSEKDAVTAFKDSQAAKKVIAAAGDVRDVWCADLTTSLAPSSVVGIFDIPNETFNNHKATYNKAANENQSRAIIRPTVFTAGNETYVASRDGIEQRAESAPPGGAGTFWNWAVKPAWQNALPTARVAECVAVYHDTNKMDVRVLNIDSWVRNFPTRTLGQTPETEYGLYFSLDVEYMTCGARAFGEGDRVVVEFRDQETTTGTPGTGPVVVGFETQPRECTSNGFDYTAYEVAGPYRYIQDTGSGWLSNSGGTPTVVDGNIDVQTHGQTRTTGGKVPDPIRFNGPYRRHIAQSMNAEAGQSTAWESQWYSGRVIEGRAPGLILGIGSQDDPTGDEVFVIAVIDESSFGAPPGTLGFYRRSYLGTEGIYSEVTNPNGWRKVGSRGFNQAAYEKNDLPAFFNAAGTEAVQLRYKKPVDATGTFQARAVKGDNSASPTLTNLQKPKMFGTELYKWVFAKDYTTAPVESVIVEDEMRDVQFTRTEDTAGNDPSPQTTHTQKGTYCIGAEYLDDVLTICRYSIDMHQVWKVDTTSFIPGTGPSNPLERAGSWYYDATIDNKLIFETWGVGGTAEAQVAGETSLYLRDSTAGFIANGVQVGAAIENTTQVLGGLNRKGTITEILSDSLIVTSVMLADGESEEVPLPTYQGWSVGDNFRIDTTSDKSIPITILDWHEKCDFDTNGPLEIDGLNFSDFISPAEQYTNVWTRQNNGNVKWYQAQLAYLDPRYGTAIVDVHRIDGGEPFSDTSMTMGPGLSVYEVPPDTIATDHWVPQSPGAITGSEHYYFGIFCNWGEVGRLEWPPLIQDLAKVGPTEYEFPFENQALDGSMINYWIGAPLDAFLYSYHGYFLPTGYFVDEDTNEIWPYEAGQQEISASYNIERREFAHANFCYQGQYIYIKNSGMQEADRSWPILPSINPGWQEWVPQLTPISEAFAYYYTGTPSYWVPSTLTGNFDHDMDHPDAWRFWGMFTRNGTRSFTADMQGFTTEPLPCVPMIGNCATTDSFDVFFSGALAKAVIYDKPGEGWVDETFLNAYAFLSGEGSNLSNLYTVLGGGAGTDFWFPLGVRTRN